MKNGKYDRRTVVHADSLFPRHQPPNEGLLWYWIVALEGSVVELDVWNCRKKFEAGGKFFELCHGPWHDIMMD